MRPLRRRVWVFLTAPSRRARLSRHREFRAFLAVLREVDDIWVVGKSSNSRALRTVIWGDCPITAVARFRTGRSFGLSDTTRAWRALGFRDAGLQEEIVTAADCAAGFDSRIRKQLLLATFQRCRRHRLESRIEPTALPEVHRRNAVLAGA